MRNRDGRYNLMFEEWVTDGPFIISPRITFEARRGGAPPRRRFEKKTRAEASLARRSACASWAA